jgi:hypothetical protein
MRDNKKNIFQLIKDGRLLESPTKLKGLNLTLDKQLDSSHYKISHNLSNEWKRFFSELLTLGDTAAVHGAFLALSKCEHKGDIYKPSKDCVLSTGWPKKTFLGCYI